MVLIDESIRHPVYPCFLYNYYLMGNRKEKPCLLTL